jgi:enoyl-CoA hydratase
MSEIRLHISDGVAVLILDAVERRNALTVKMAQDITAALQAVEDNDAVRALVMHGAGEAFCAGAHLSLLADSSVDPLSEEAMAEIEAVYSAFIGLRQLRVPSIAAVHGAAVGAGLNLALAATMRLVGDSARLFSGFLRIGLHPGGGHLLMLALAAGRETATGLAIFGQELTAPEAVAKGLAWEQVPDELLVERAIQLAAAVSSDRALVRRTLDSLQLSLGPPLVPWPAAVELERGAQQWSMRRNATGSSAREERT